MSIILDPNTSPQPFQQYPYRFVIASTYSLISIINGICWVIVTPISVPISKAYDVSAAMVSLIPMSFLLFYVIFNFPSNWVIDVKGIRKGVVIGSVLTCLGCGVRCLVGVWFGFVVFGQVLCAIGQPFLTNASMKIGTRWFLPQNRALFMAILNVVGLVGGAAGFFIPPLFVSDQQPLEDVREHFYNLQLYTALVSLFSTLLILILFKQKPPSPPSISSMTQNTNFTQSFSVMLKNKKFLSLAFSFGIINGVFNMYSSVMDDILDPYGFHTEDVSAFGTAMMVFGIIGAALCGAYVQRTLKYRRIFWGCSLLGISLSIAFPLSIRLFSNPQDHYWLFFFLIGLQGLVYVPVQPMSIDYGIDTMFPVGQAQITGLMLSLGQILGIIFVEVSQLIFRLGNQNNSDQQKKDASLKSIIFLGICLTIGCIILMLQNSELKRSKLQRGKTKVESASLISQNANDFIQAKQERN